MAQHPAQKFFSPSLAYISAACTYSAMLFSLLASNLEVMANCQNLLAFSMLLSMLCQCMKSSFNFYFHLPIIPKHLYPQAIRDSLLRLKLAPGEQIFSISDGEREGVDGLVGGYAMRACRRTLIQKIDFLWSTRQIICLMIARQGQASCSALLYCAHFFLSMGSHRQKAVSSVIPREQTSLLSRSTLPILKLDILAIFRVLYRSLQWLDSLTFLVALSTALRMILENDPKRKHCFCLEQQTFEGRMSLCVSPLTCITDSPSTKSANNLQNSPKDHMSPSFLRLRSTIDRVHSTGSSTATCEQQSTTSSCGLMTKWLLMLCRLGDCSLAMVRQLLISQAMLRQCSSKEWKLRTKREHSAAS